MTWDLLLVGLLGVVVWAVMGVLLHHHLAEIADHLARAEQRPAARRQEMDRLRKAVEEQLRSHVAATDDRMRDVEKAVVEVRQQHNELVGTINWMAPWVRGWAEAASGGQR